MFAQRATLFAFTATALLVGCARDETQTTGDTAAGEAAPAEFSRAATIEGAFKTPESVRFDAAEDVFFVSNINGVPSAKDNNGFITRVRAEGGEIDSLMFIAGGRGGVTLNAPKGLAITGDTLWVADIDAVRAFDKRTGRGIAWDDGNQRFIIVTFSANDILAWKPGDSTTTSIATGKGVFDGVERLADGRILVSSWADSSLYVLDGSALVRAVGGVQSPADIGVDTKRNRVAVPIFEGNRVELFAIPAKE